MSENETEPSRSLIRRLRRTLGDPLVVYIVSVVVVVFASTVGLAAVRLMGLEGQLGFVTAAELLRSAIFVTVGFAAFAVGVGLLRLPGRLHYAGLGLLQFGAGFVVFSNVVGHYFYEATGSSLNWPVLVQGVEYIIDAPQMLFSETPATGWVLFGVGLAVVAVGPPAAARFTRWCVDEPDVDCPAPSRRAGILCVAGGVASLLIAAIPATWLDYDVGFSRDSSIHLLATAFRSADIDEDSAEPWFAIAEVRVEPDDSSEIENVAVVIMESVRASATTVHNPELETTPFLAELSEESLTFEQAYAMVPHTSKALIPILCGVPPRITMEIVEARPGGHPGRCLATVLGERGYDSLFIQAATEQFEARRGSVANMGYDRFIPLEEMETEGYEEANYFGVEDDVMLPYSRRWLQDGGDEPFFATYLTITPHHDYRAPRTYGRFQFAESDVFNRYLNSVHYIDHFVENLIEQYRELGLYDSTLFVILGDHGEAFGEHGRAQHDNVPWQEGLHVPLLIHDGTGSLETGRSTVPVSHIDLAPTVLELMGFDVRDGEYPGVPVMDADPRRTLYFSCWYDNQCAGLLRNGHKYIHHFENRSDELFDVVDDPRERENLLGESGQSAGELRREVFQWRRAVEAGYERHQRRVVQRRVLSSLPQMEHSSDDHVGESLQIVGYEWSGDAENERRSLSVAFRVLRNFTLGDEVAFRVGESEATREIGTPMRGVWPSLFWQMGQVLIGEIPADTLEQYAGGDSVELWLAVGEERGKIGDIAL